MLGSITVERRPDGIYAMLETQPAAMLLAAGVQMGLVAGAFGQKRTNKITESGRSMALSTPS